MAIKELQTRIALKYDSYSAWTSSPGKDLILLKGEIGICEIPTDNTIGVTTAPTVLFKVGDGVHPFEELKWVSAFAADVYAWAKAETVKLEGNTINFKTGDAVIHSIDLSSFATDSEVSAITAGFEARISRLESSAGDGNITNDQYDSLDQRLDTLEGADTVEGSVANAIKVAKAYTDEKDTAVRAYVAQVETAAGTATAKIATAEAKLEELATSISTNTQGIEAEAYTREQADLALNTKIGDGFDATNTVKSAIAAAESKGQQGIDAAADVANALTALTSTGAVAQNSAAIAQISTSLTDLTSTVESNNNNLNTRVQGIEAFFAAADHDGTDGGLRDALDTLVEIQDYLTGDGSAAGSLLSRMTEAEQDISALEALLATEGAFDQRISGLDSRVTANESNLSTLQNLTSGYSGAGAIKAAIEAAQGVANQGIADAASAKSLAESASTAAEAAKSQLVTHGTLIDNIQTVATTAAADVAALTARMGTAEGSITTLLATVSTGNDANTKLRDAITNLQTLTGDPSKGNEALYTGLTTLQGTISTQAGSISDARSVADTALSKANDALSKAAAIEADYITSEDELIFQCGTSTEVTHKVATT